MKQTRTPLLFCALVAVLVAGTTQAQVITSGTLNLPINDNGTGLYVNVIDGTTFTGPGTFPSLGGPGANYDFNIFGGTTSWSLFSPGSSGQSPPTPVPVGSKGYVSSTTTGPALSLPPGFLIDSASVFNTGTPSANGLATGNPVYFGFRFRDEGADLASAADDTIHFGYALIMLPDPTLTQNGVLVSYAYENTPGVGITVPVPEPGALGLIGAASIAAAAVVRRRRR